MTTALEGGEGSASRPDRSLPGTHSSGGWVDPRAGLDRCGKFRPTGIRSPDRPTRSHSLYRLSYPAVCEVRSEGLCAARNADRSSWAMPWFKPLLAGLASRRTRLRSQPGVRDTCGGQMTSGQGFSRSTFGFPMSVSVHQCSIVS
jgi:hypothetical protein